MVDLYEIDKKISEIEREEDFFSFLRPTNQEEERKKFFSALQSGRIYDPVFCYKERKTSGEKGWLRKIRSELDENDGMQLLFAKKLDFILTQFELTEADDDSFGSVAVKLYGKPPAECIELARNILSETTERGYTFPDETVTPGEMASILRDELERKGIGWSVVVSDKIVPKITVSGKEKKIYINSGIDYTPDEVQRLKVHEIEVHIYRGANGDIQPYGIFRGGLAGYDETEEGLAIMAEKISGCLEKDTRQMKLYAGRALSAELCMNGSFYETFMALREIFPDYLAYRLTERGKRGLRDTSKKGGLTKGFHYISGFIKMRKYIEEGGDLSIIYVGKIGLDDVDIVGKLLAEGVLALPKYLPEFVKQYG